MTVTPKIPGAASSTPKIPVTVLTGFLGSGKTTLVNYILTAEHGHRIAVIENEFGDIPIDNDLVLGNDGDEKIIEMSNGCCLCCTARTDLIDILTSLLERKEKFDRILIETSGMADPSPVAQTFFDADETVTAHYALDAIVTLVDAKYIEQHLDEVAHDGVGGQATNQIAFADRIVINKVDLVDEETLARVTDRVTGINATAQVLNSSFGETDLSQILGVGAFGQRRGSTSAQDEWLANDTHVHEPTLTSVSVEVLGELDRDRFDTWLGELIDAQGNDLYRYKGLLAIEGVDAPFVVQGLHQMFTVRESTFDREDVRRSRMVFIGRRLDQEALTAGLRSCLVGAPAYA
jgi:G3E family GTPase